MDRLRDWGTLCMQLVSMAMQLSPNGFGSNSEDLEKLRSSKLSPKVYIQFYLRQAEGKAVMHLCLLQERTAFV